MKMLKVLMLILGLTAFASASSFAEVGKYGSKDEAQAMAEKAAELVKKDPKAAFVKFQEKEGGFIDRDLYVFVFDKAGNFLAHGAKPVLVGKGGLAMKDVSGFPFVQAFMDVKEKGWVDYKWPDLLDANKIRSKSAYIIKEGEYTLGVGYFKE